MLVVDSAIRYKGKRCDYMDKQYVITSRNIAHVVRTGEKEGLIRFWDTACGKWVHSFNVVDALPDGVRMCKRCKKHEEMQ